MKRIQRISFPLLLFFGFWFYSFHPAEPPKIKFPYKAAGLNDRQAAAHLLSRFTFGATPSQIDAVVKQGLVAWFESQLNATYKDDSLKSRLGAYDAINLSNEEVLLNFPKNFQVVRMAINDSIISKDSVGSKSPQYRAAIDNYMASNGFRPQKDLNQQFINQKILRSVYSENQLQEVMTSFWFNHFNVSLTKDDCSHFIPAYERDVIRPQALGNFSDLLIATAKSPAMLYYLDNFSSASDNNPFNKKKDKKQPQPAAPTGAVADTLIARLKKIRKEKGINENYAREVMELHTMGVDGGYSQQDVTEAARVLTGWTIYPFQVNRKTKALERSARFEKEGFVRDGDFLFAANRHDAGTKTVLGKQYGPDKGYAEGVELLNDLAIHPSTAKFICKKIATRFVSDQPVQSLVEKMSKTFLSQKGDIKAVLITMVSAREFWEPGALREKTKSPFELAIGAIRSLNAKVEDPYPLFNWISRMGERIYSYQAPTGFPDKGQYWINTGALLNRMNFGLALASGKISGIRADLPALNQYHEPESSQAALVTYSKLIIPERDLAKTVERLKPMLNDPELSEKVNKASQATAGNDNDMQAANKTTTTAKPARKENVTMLAQVVGVIIGSPEYQRR
ncbi:DUF1800 domain-containing protein [Dyadobacter luteus]|jgi:uncharacterized protein (DUF1800 family)|uniref:DUF1800 domain-containing protein n=1 Tax=Dyadobacter luteus TaxID=2259619 RepID=A0A3D8Y5X9_9BACT|nr:DUF1800 domain-containing protein [Dyadobacter luteus]REA58059.1 DUF1800 domain-containing protein [Dyadobacter luteus]